MKDNLTDLAYWESHWSGLTKVEWDDGEKEYIPDMHSIIYPKYHDRISGKTCLEVGCYPGRYMRYFIREYGMKVDGIDIMPYENNNKNDDSLNVMVTDFNEYKSVDKYDLICSFGFIEHFNNFGEIIVKHLELAKKDGLVIITVPNYSVGWRFFLKRLYSKRLFKTHNRDAMRVECLNEVLSSINCKSFTVSHILFSEKLFKETSLIKKNVGRLLQKVIKKTLYLDRKLSTEIIVQINK